VTAVQGPPYYNEHGIPRSRWLAIDAHGSLGMFECGEAGAVPLPWPLGTLPGDFHRDRFPLDALRAGRVVASGRAIPRSGGRIGLRAIVVLDRRALNTTYRSEPLVSTVEASLTLDPVFEAPEPARPTLASSRALDNPLVELLARDPCVVGSMDEDALARWLDALSDTGVYRWASLDPQAVGLYTRTDVPTRPIALTELPERARRELDLVRFSVAFADGGQLQLADHFGRSDLVTRGPSDPLRRALTTGGPRTP